MILEEDAQRVRLAALGLLDKLEQAVTELDKGILTRKEKDGETVFEIQKGKGKGLVDRTPGGSPHRRGSGRSPVSMPCSPGYR